MTYFKTFIIVFSLLAASLSGADEISMKDIAGKYLNSISQADLEKNGDQNLIYQVPYASLPATVTVQINKLKISVSAAWSDEIVKGSSDLLLIDWISEEDQHGIYEVKAEGETFGWILTPFSCNSDGCEFGGAVYLNSKGGIVSDQLQ